MTTTDTLDTLAAELHRLGDPSTAATVTRLADDYRAGLLDRPGVLDALDTLITLQQVCS